MSESFDVIVVGAGPAGATAAYFLGEAGQRVLVLEKAQMPRFKPCGGGLSARFLAEQFPFSFEGIVESHARSISYALGNRIFTVPLPDRPLQMVMRDQFDAAILAHVRAEVRQAVAVRKIHETGDRVIIETGDGNTFEGRYLIGADGANSVIAHAMGLRRAKTLVAAVEAEVSVPPEIFRRFANAPLFIFGEIRMGYLWVFPKATHLSVGIAALHPKPGQLQTVLERVMHRYGIVLHGVPMHGHPLPIYSRREPIATSRVLLAGDAAGLADPLTGEGIRLAIKSGRLAAEAILAGRPDRYPALIDRHIGLSQTFAIGLSWLFYHFPQVCFMLAAGNPLTTRAFVDVLSDQAGYPELILRVFGTMPLYLLTQGVAGLAGLLGGPEWRQRVFVAVFRGIADKRSAYSGYEHGPA